MMQDNQDIELSMQVFHEFMNTARLLRRELSTSLAEFGLTRSQFAVLREVTDDGITLGKLSKSTRRDPSNITGIVDRLEESGLIKREKDPNDRRVILVILTDKGLQLRKKIKSFHDAQVHQRLEGFDKQEKVLFLQLIRKLRGDRA